MEKVKWYRQLLGNAMAEEGDSSARLAAEMEQCLAAVAAAWPEVKDVARPKQPNKKSGPDKKRRKLSHAT